MATEAGCSPENGESASSSKSTPEPRVVPDNEHKMATIPRARTPRPRLHIVRGCVCSIPPPRASVCVTRGEVRKLFWREGHMTRRLSASDSHRHVPPTARRNRAMRVAAYVGLRACVSTDTHACKAHTPALLGRRRDRDLARTVERTEINRNS